MDRLEVPVRLIMHGIPESWVNQMTATDMQIMLEIIKRDQMAYADKAGAYAVNKGVAQSFNKDSK